MKILIAFLLLLLSGCVISQPPFHLVVVQDKKQLATPDRPGGNLGLYVKQWHTIFLAPGADENVLNHELVHHYYGALGESTWLKN